VEIIIEKYQGCSPDCRILSCPSSPQQVYSSPSIQYNGKDLITWIVLLCFFIMAVTSWKDLSDEKGTL